MAQSVEDKPRGILNPKVGEQKFQLMRYESTQQLSLFVEHYWIVKWDLRGLAPYNSETLPHPSIHLAIEPEIAHVVGVVTRKFSRLLKGQGWAFGIKFRPGGFYPFVQTPISTYTDKSIPLTGLFGETGSHFEAAMRAAPTDDTKVVQAEEFLRQRSPAYDENIALINQIIDATKSERTITKVDHLVDRFQINKRGLQRLFSQYVGVSPKWVIQRYRLHEAIEQVAAGEVAAGEITEWSKLAVELGYFDQAHFIKDFKSIVGMTPAEYAKKLA